MKRGGACVQRAVALLPGETVWRVWIPTYMAFVQADGNAGAFLRHLDRWWQGDGGGWCGGLSSLSLSFSWLKCIPWMRLKVQCEARKAGLGFRAVALPCSKTGLDELKPQKKNNRPYYGVGYFISNNNHMFLFPNYAGRYLDASWYPFSRTSPWTDSNLSRPKAMC